MGLVRQFGGRHSYLLRHKLKMFQQIFNCIPPVRKPLKYSLYFSFVLFLLFITLMVSISDVILTFFLFFFFFENFFFLTKKKKKKKKKKNIEQKQKVAPFRVVVPVRDWQFGVPRSKG